MSFAFAIQRAGIDPEHRRGFFHGGSAREDAADMFGFELLEREGAPDFGRPGRDPAPNLRR